MKCQEVSLPPASVLTPDLARCNYVDSYQLSIGRELPLDVAINIFCGPLPWFFRTLMKVRDIIAKRLGLRTVEHYVPGSPEHPARCEPRDTVGFFRVFERTEDEAILGQDDRHLNFRVSVLVEGGHVTISTMVSYNNLLGRIYFAIVKPVHRFIVPSGLASDFGRYLERSHPQS